MTEPGAKAPILIILHQEHSTPGRVGRLLRERGHPLEPRTKRGHTPLQIACALGHLDAAKAMVELGADVDAQSPDGVALDIAKREGKADVVAWLANRR